eukprot:638049-Hanusia_phi.AAC.2
MANDGRDASEARAITSALEPVSCLRSEPGNTSQSMENVVTTPSNQAKNRMKWPTNQVRMRELLLLVAKAWLDRSSSIISGSVKPEWIELVATLGGQDRNSLEPYGEWETTWLEVIAKLDSFNREKQAKVEQNAISNGTSPNLGDRVASMFKDLHSSSDSTLQLLVGLKEKELESREQKDENELTILNKRLDLYEAKLAQDQEERRAAMAVREREIALREAQDSQDRKAEFALREKELSLKMAQTTQETEEK